MNAPTGEALDALRAEAQQDGRALRDRVGQLGEDEIDLILSNARSHYAWQDKPISNETLHRLYEITAAWPTSMNTCPARFIFVTSDKGKARVAKPLKPSKLANMETAPVCAIIAHDLDFWTELPFLFPHEDRRPFFEGKPDHCEAAALRTGTLQGAYFMIAARALGFDVGAMSGFSNHVIDAEFFAGTRIKSNFLCNLGYADETALFQKLPQFAFDLVCSFA